MTDDTAVKVVVRIRPQTSRDIADLCHVCTKTVPNEPQIWIGCDKSYTFDQVFNTETLQDEIFDTRVAELVDGCFDGYNATVLAYGQTGSGKTYTMGTGFDHSFHLDQRGIIPRAIERLFRKIECIQNDEKEKGCVPPDIKVHVQFLELYNEEVIDLLNSSQEYDDKNKQHIKIHEKNGEIYAQGVHIQCVTNIQEALQCLKVGSLSRTTASTGMNVQSSRSHAIFSLHIKQQRVVKLGKAIAGDDNCNSTLHSHSDSLSEFETLTAKFHFVDLAGSERLKRTGATGDRQKESISINSGLLALGNVISALGDKAKKATHIPYRDSKLTRLLQDSLGGNSRTLMIACVSPSDRDFVETLSTLKYANRAKNIRNKVMANMDKSSQTIKALLDKVESLQMELLEFKQGKRLLRDDGEECINDMYHENNMLQSENNSLKTRIKALQETIDRLTSKNSALLVEKESEEWAVNGTGTKREISTLIQGYVSEIESLRAKLIEYEEACALLRKSVAKTSPFSPYSVSTVAITGHYDIKVETPPSLTDLLAEARKDVKKRKKRINKLEGSEKGNVIEECDEDMKAIEENDNFEGDQNEEDSSSDSEMEKADQNEKLSDNLAEISCDISLKEKLIRQLEISQKRLHNMRQHYEEKISQLQSKILEAEKERDRIISNLSKTSESKSEEKRIRADYEKKISCLRNDVKNFENAKKHHVQLVASASNYENQLKKLKQEVAEMKKTKITLLNKMKEETKKHKDFELKQNKEIAVLRKEKLNKESQIKALEAEKRRKEIVLKKRTEEIINLKKRVGRTMSPRNVKMMKAGPVLKAAKQAWQNLEKKINKLVLNRQNIAAIVKDMNKFLKDREKIGRGLEKVNRKRDAAIRAFKGSKVIEEFDDEIENLKANIEYIHDNLSACQSALTGLEESMENVNYNDIVNTLNNMRLDESYYIIEKIVLLAIEQSFQNSQKELIVKDLETQLAQTTENNTFADQLLFHVVQHTDLHEFVEHTAANVKESDISESDSESGSSSPDESLASFSRESTFVSDKPRRTKARNIAATTEQLLFSSTDPAMEAHNPLSQQSEFEREIGFSEAKSLSYVILPSSKEDTNGNQIDNEVPPREKTYTIHDYMSITNVNGRPCSYLACSTMIRGHKLPVTDVTCTNEVLFSSSEDGVVKIWDLSTFTEIQKLNHINHIKNQFDSIKKICYCEYTRRAFSASSSEITVWDVRQNPAPILQKLRNTGSDSDLRLDSQINDISLNPYGTLLYAASSRAVTIWDLRNFQCIGALDLGHGVNVTRIDVSDIELQKNRIICGTENNAIKVFEVEEDACGLQYPKYNLNPPHDIKSLTTRSNTLLTSSNDLTIKKWNLNKRILEHTFKAAQDSPICSLNILQEKQCFLSGSVSGCLKLWSLSNCTSLEEIQAHQSSINSIASNNSHIFTASSDNLIGVWRLQMS